MTTRENYAVDLGQFWTLSMRRWLHWNAFLLSDQRPLLTGETGRATSTSRTAPFAANWQRCGRSTPNFRSIVISAPIRPIATSWMRRSHREVERRSADRRLAKSPAYVLKY